MLQSMGSQRVGHDLATEQQQQILIELYILILYNTQLFELMKKPILKIVITHVTVSPSATLSGPASESVSCVLSLLTVCAVGVRVCDS